MAEATGSISVERALRWVRHFVEREWTLLLPIVLAFLALPRMVVMLLTPLQRLPQTLEGIQAFSASLPGWWTPLLFAMLLIGMVGGMALVALALLPRLSVGEAIGLAFRRLPVWLGLGLIAGALAFAVLLAVSFAAAIAGTGRSLSLIVPVLGLALIGILLLLAVPPIMIHRIGPVAALRESWRIWSGTVWRTLGGLLLFAAAAWLVVLALQVSLGSMLLLVGRMLGQPQLGQVLAMLFASVAASIGWGGFYLLLAAFYRQRAGLD